MSLRRVPGTRILLTLAAVVAALAVSGALVALVGQSPLQAYRVMWSGAVSNRLAIGNTLVAALPIIFAALAFTVAFRSGVINIGMEGQLYAGAVGAALVGSRIHVAGVVHVPLCLLAAAIGGAAWAAIPALLKVLRGVNEIVTSLFLNYIAIYLTDWALNGPIKDPTSIYPQTKEIDRSAQLPALVSGTKITIGILIAIAVAAFVWLLLRRTRLGFEMQTVGASESVARHVGISSRRVAFTAFLISGAIAGFAGAVEILGNQFVLLPDFSPGWGYTGIAASLLGGLSAVGSVIAGLFFGVLNAGSSALQFQLGVSPYLAAVIQAIAVIFVLGSPWIYTRFRRWRAVAHEPSPVASGRVPPVLEGKP